MNGSQRLKENHNIISYSYSQSRLIQTQSFPWHPLEAVDKRQMCSTVSPCLQHDIWACITVTSFFVRTVSVQCPLCLPVQKITFYRNWLVNCWARGQWGQGVCPRATQNCFLPSLLLWLPAAIWDLLLLVAVYANRSCCSGCSSWNPGAPPGSEWE